MENHYTIGIPKDNVALHSIEEVDVHGCSVVE
jgi:hypothetical protein